MIQPLAYVNPEAKIADNVVIEPFVTIHKNVVIEDGTWIGSNVTIMEGARIGKNCRIFPGAVISAVPQDLKFDGDGDYVKVPRAPNLDMVDQLSIELWMNADPSNLMEDCCQQRWTQPMMSFMADLSLYAQG